MDARGIFERLDKILEGTHVGILTTVDEQGYPRSRWMTPTLLSKREGNIYAVTSPTFRKSVELSSHAQVEWIFQTKALDEVLTANGKITVIDNPSLKSEVLQALGRNLSIFWRVNPDQASLVVLETTVEELTLFLPMKNERYKVVV